MNQRHQEHYNLMELLAKSKRARSALHRVVNDLNNHEALISERLRSLSDDTIDIDADDIQSRIGKAAIKLREEGYRTLVINTPGYPHLLVGAKGVNFLFCVAAPTHRKSDIQEIEWQLLDEKVAGWTGNLSLIDGADDALKIIGDHFASDAENEGV